MKSIKSILLGIITLSLLSCGPSENTSILGSNDIVTSQNSSSQPISSSEFAPTSSEKDSSSEENISNWTASELAFMKENLHGHVVPYAPIEGGEWIWNEHENCIAYRKSNGTLDDIDYFNEAMVKAGYIDGSDEEHGCYNIYERYVYLPLKNSELHEEIQMFITRYMKTQEFNVDVTYHIDNTSWPENEISQAIKEVHEIDLVLPKPSFSYQDIELNAIKEFGQCIITLYGDDHAKDYYLDLINANFKHVDDIFYQYCVADKLDRVMIAVSYDEEILGTTISVMKYNLI